MVYTAKYTDATKIYTKSGLSATEFDVTTNDSQLINEAETELEVLTGRKFTGSNAITEYLDGPKKDILGITGTMATSLRVSFYPIQTITEFKFLDMNGNTTKTLTSADYWLEQQADPLTNGIINNGYIKLKTDVFVPGTQSIKIGYTYGYTSVPFEVSDLATCLGAMRLWIRFMAGCYNRLDSYSIPQQNVSKGDFYTRGQAIITLLKEESERLLDRVGRRPRILFGATGADR